MSNGYKIDFTTNTLIMNYKFAAAAKNFGSAEYNIIKDIQADFPNINIITKAGRKITTSRPNKRLTYVNMENYIKAYDNAEELMLMFNKTKDLSKVLKSPYKYVRDWFVAQFPDYDKLQNDLNNKASICPIKILDTEKYATKEGIAS